NQKLLIRFLLQWKKDCDRERHGEKAILALLAGEMLPVLFTIAAKVLSPKEVGVWAKGLLCEHEDEVRCEVERSKMVSRTKEAAFLCLSPSEQSLVDSFIWLGCCMHKELNMVKGGVVAIMGFWKDKDLSGP
ncbi:hypothetical protein M422DRAFT_136940, partial [Sphaerobolus stellatus SS14]